MNLIKFDSSTQRQQLKAPTILFAKSGGIHLNVETTRLMQLSNETRLTIAKNADSPDDWYIYKDDNGLLFKHSSKDNGEMKVSCRNLTRAFLETFKLTQSVRLEIKPKPVTLPDGTSAWLILTGAAKEQATRELLQMAKTAK